MKNAFKTYFLHLCTAAIALVALPAFAQVSIIANINNDSIINIDQIGNIYLGKSSTFPNGNGAKIINQPESSAIRDYFYNKVTHKSPDQVKAVWSRLLFTGKGTPPKELESSKDIKKFISSNTDAIGYIEKSAVDSSVKVIMTLE